MKRSLAIGPMLLALLAAGAPARAELPLSLDAEFGGGVGGGRSRGELAGPLAAHGALGAGWRLRPGQRLTLRWESGAIMDVPAARAAILSDSPRLESTDFDSWMVGLEWSDPERSNAGPFLGTDLGFARLRSGFDGYSSFTSPAVRTFFPPEVAADDCVAFGFTAGSRLVARPGPLGFLIALRALGLAGDRVALAKLELTLGLTCLPLAPRRGEPR